MEHSLWAALVWPLPTPLQGNMGNYKLKTLNGIGHDKKYRVVQLRRFYY